MSGKARDLRQLPDMMKQIHADDGDGCKKDSWARDQGAWPNDQGGSGKAPLPSTDGDPVRGRDRGAPPMGSPTRMAPPAVGNMGQGQGNDALLKALAQALGLLLREAIMPRYNYSGGPADWASQQQSRRDDQIRTILNLMMTMKQNQTGREDEMFNRGLEERRVAAYEQNAAPNPPQISEWQYKLLHPEAYPEKPSALQEKTELLQKDPLLYAKLFPGSAGGAETKPSDYDKKAAKAEAMFKAGKISEPEYIKAQIGDIGDVTSRQTAQIRSGVDRATMIARSKLPINVSEGD